MTPIWSIRPARSGDATAIAVLTDLAYAKYVPILGRSPLPMTWDHARIVAEWQVWVAEDEGDLVGVLVLAPEFDGLLIESVAVAPAAQGRGIGRGLIGHALGQAGAQGLATLRLYTNANMTDNIALYRRCGFVETKRDHLGDRVLVHMSVDVLAQSGPVGPG